MPWHDWQFWLVTVLAAVGLWMLLRSTLPRRKNKADADDASCSHCASSSAALKSRRVALTVEKRRV